MRGRSMWLALAWLGIAQAASAEDSGWYIAANLGLADAPNDSGLAFTDVPLMTGRTEDNQATWGLSAGYRFNPIIALELGYVDLGEITAQVTDASGLTDARSATAFSADGATLAMIGTLPLGKWEPYLKAGVFFSNTDFEYSGSFAGRRFAERKQADNVDVLYGIGVGYAVNEHLRISLESVFFPKVGEPGTGRSKYLNTSLGASWRF